MVEVVYLAPGEEMPDVGDDTPWLAVEASGDGLFYGTGSSRKPDGDWVGYGSLAENDVTLDSALKAANEWALKYGVRTIWVQLKP